MKGTILQKGNNRNECFAKKAKGRKGVELWRLIKITTVSNKNIKCELFKNFNCFDIRPIARESTLNIANGPNSAYET